MKIALVLLFSLGLGNAKPLFGTSLDEVKKGILYGTGKIGGSDYPLHSVYHKLMTYGPGHGIGRYGDVKVVVDPTTGKVFKYTDIEDKYTTDKIVENLIKGHQTGGVEGITGDVFGRTIYTPIIKFLKHFGVEDKYINDVIEEVLIKKYLHEKYGSSYGFGGSSFGGKYDDLLIKKFLSDKYGKTFDVEGKYGDDDVYGVLIKKFISDKYGKHFDVEGSTDSIYDSLIKKFISEKYGKHFNVGHKYTTDGIYTSLVKKYLSEKYGKEFGVGGGFGGKFDDVFGTGYTVGKIFYNPFTGKVQHFDVEDKYNTGSIYDYLVKKIVSGQYGEGFDVEDYIKEKLDDVFGTGSGVYGKDLGFGDKYVVDKIYKVLLKKYLTEKYGYGNKFEGVFGNGHSLYNPTTKYFGGVEGTLGKVHDYLVKKYISEKYGKNFGYGNKFEDVFGTGHPMYNPVTKYFGGVEGTLGKIHDYLVKKYISEKYGKNFGYGNKFEDVFGTGHHMYNPVTKYFGGVEGIEGGINDYLVKKYVSEKYGKNFGYGNKFEEVFGTGHPLYNPITKYFGGVEGIEGRIHDYLVKKYISGKYGYGNKFEDLFGAGFGDVTKYLGGEYTVKLDSETGKPYIVKDTSDEVTGGEGGIGIESGKPFSMKDEGDDEEGTVVIEYDEETGKPYIVKTKEGVKYDVETGKPYIVKSKGTVGVEFGVESGKPYIVKDVSEDAEGLDDVQDSKYVEINSIPEGKYTKEDVKSIKYGKKHMTKKFVPEV